MNSETMNIIITIAIVCSLISIFGCFFTFIFSVYLHSKIIKLETQIELFTKIPESGYHNNNRRQPPPLHNQQQTIKTEEIVPEDTEIKPPKRTMHANDMKSFLPLQRVKKRADEEMDKKLIELGLIKDKSNARANSTD